MDSPVYFQGQITTKLYKKIQQQKTRNLKISLYCSTEFCTKHPCEKGLFKWRTIEFSKRRWLFIILIKVKINYIFINSNCFIRSAMWPMGMLFIYHYISLFRDFFYFGYGLFCSWIWILFVSILRKFNG